ncbi:glycoside hydrolase family 88 protein [Natronoflexus pectinivorans]|uniref:Rhamnogalacturonyl hydrolase YesR n=1 Tax=Natronoflexus pectinivorans TaxID=682526 RepID=A0A4R2GGS0_9BACT|nr:glycoside hydrolase family 88 protein [Natronoflexus pectinivorans]TCO07457.1 rhamnogalacturonyl hydrolase YesR [Natronoflexus pectinivorans]
MIRRDFISRLGLFGGLVVAPASLLKGCVKSQSDVADFYTPIREKVKMAMLTTQKQNWEHGMATQAFVEASDEKMMILMAKEAVVRQDSDGRLAVLGVANGITDSATPGEAVLKTSVLLNDPRMKEATDRMLDYFFNGAPKSDEGLIYHSHHGPELWADSMYMAPPFFAYAGHPEEALKQLNGIREKLWDKDKRLYAYRWSDITKQISNPKLWGLANGHAIHGKVKLIEYLPPEYEADRQKLIVAVQDHLEGCLNYMRTDFLFHDSIDNSSTFVETSLSERLAYTIFKGIKQGWLHKDYLETGLKMRDAVYSKVDEFGFVRGILGPPSYSEPGTSTEGQACFLMMEAAFDDLQIS